MTDHEVLVNNKPHRVQILERNNNVFLVEVDEKTVTVKIKNPGRSSTATIEINGKPLPVKIDGTQRRTLEVKLGGRIFNVQLRPKPPQASVVKLEPVSVTKRPVAKLPTEKDAVTAPIAGRIVLLKADIGQRVEKGECICVLEAMKMENEIAAPKAGIVNEIKVSEGGIVNKGDILAVIT